MLYTRQAVDDWFLFTIIKVGPDIIGGNIGQGGAFWTWVISRKKKLLY